MAKDIHVHLNNERVAELEPMQGVRVDPTTSVRQTVQLMQQSRTGCALVCEGTKLVGIFTEQDYLRRVAGSNRGLDGPISECMSRNPATICVTDSIATLVQRIHKGRYRRLPVLNERGELAGCVTVRDLVHHLAEHFPAAVLNLAPVSKPVQQNREGA
jgi:CBS domain-containing protein